jgi:hypothetical protein
MPHGAFLQLPQAVESARYLPRWQQNVLGVFLLAVGATLLALGEIAGIVPLALVALFTIQRTRRHR